MEGSCLANCINSIDFPELLCGGRISGAGFKDDPAAAAPPWNMFLAMLVLYIGCSLVIWILFRLISEFLDRIKLKEFDRQLGAVLGLAKGVVLCVVITMFAATLLAPPQRGEVINSKSGYCAAWLLYQAHDVMPDEVHDVIHPYMHPHPEFPHVGEAPEQPHGRGIIPVELR